jgi:membrane fusion protein, multidrug efflux system
VRRLLVLLSVLVLVSAGGLVALLLVRHHRETTEAQRRRDDATKGPRVTVVEVTKTAGVRDVTLPADVRAFTQATLYAKSLGYLQSVSVERGDRVKKDEVLAVIQSPETDQQVAAALSDLAVKARDARRARDLAPRGVMSQQELDRAEGDYQVSRANLERTRALQGYQQVKAPFDGTVTQRFLDVGALVQGGVAVVEVADFEHLRVNVFAGQDVAGFLKVGDAVTLVQDEKPDVKIVAALSRISEALDPRSRTMQCEIWLDNTHWGLYPGTFLHATLHVDVPPLPTVPSEAVFLRGDKLLVAVIEGNRAHFRPVQPGLDDGKTLQIREGLNGNETVAVNFPSDLPDGAAVQPEPRKQPQPRASR